MALIRRSWLPNRWWVSRSTSSHRAIADQIRKKREAVAYIEVRPEKGHFFTITIKTSERRVFRRTGAAETGGETGE